MAERDWDPDCMTGIPSIDAQHMALFESAQELHRAFRSGKGKEVLPALLKELEVYCLSHFHDEETHMQRLGFPDLATHQEEHRRLMARVYDLHERFRKGEALAAMEVSVLVTDWLKTHIKGLDQAFAEFIRGQDGRPFLED